MSNKTIKSLNEVPQSNDNWIFVVRRMRAWIDGGEQGTYRPRVILTINRMNGKIQDFGFVEQATIEIVEAALISAMLEPTEILKSIPERPSQVQFDDRDLMDAMLPTLQEIGVRGRFFPNHEFVDEIVSGMEKELRKGHPEIPGLLSMRKVTPAMVGELFEAAVVYYESAPWVQFANHEILSIQVPPHKEPCYVSVLGQGGMEYGLALYKIWDDVERMYSIHDSIDEVIPRDGSHTLLFEEIFGVPFDDLDAIERYGWKVADSREYPVPVIFTLDDDIKRPDREEILWYQAALLAIPIFVSDHMLLDKDNKLKAAQAQIPVQTSSEELVVEIKYPAGELSDPGTQISNSAVDDFESENVLPFDRRALEGDLARVLGTEDSYDFKTDLGKAQDLAYQAWEESNPAKRIILAHQALAISPDCADAYVLLAEDEADSLQSALEYYQKGVEAGERALGEQFFEQNVGHFWGMMETRPYMRALYGYADCLWNLDQKGKTVIIFQEMLRLNPGDNQGIRYELVDCFLNLNREQELDDLLGQYEGDASAVWLYTRALVIFRKEGSTEIAGRTLNNALEYNPFVPDFLMGKKRIPNRLPETIGFGDENEAVAYAAKHLNHWRRTSGAVEWLSESAEAEEQE